MHFNSLTRPDMKKKNAYEVLGYLDKTQLVDSSHQHLTFMWLLKISARVNHTCKLLQSVISFQRVDRFLVHLAQGGVHVH